MALARNTSADLGLQVGTTSYTAAYTVGSGSNRILFVGFFGDSTRACTGVTYNGVAMTNVGFVYTNGADRGIELWYLLNPASGSNNVVASFSASTVVWAAAADYTDAKQSGQPDASNTGENASGTTSLNANLTVVASNCWAIAVLRESAGGAVTWSGTSNELVASGGLHFADSNGTVSTGSVTVSATMGTANIYRMISASFAPTAGGGTKASPSFRQSVRFVRRSF
jgi:hypothetical protein